MTTAQLQALKTDITVTHANTVFQGKTLLQLWNGFDFETLAKYFNTTAAPQVDLWRPNITKTEASKSIVASEFMTMPVARQNTWFAILQTETIDATIQTVRQNFSDLFTNPNGAPTMLANLTAMAKKAATNFELLFTTSNVSSVFGVTVTSNDIYQSLTA